MTGHEIDPVELTQPLVNPIALGGLFTDNEINMKIRILKITIDADPASAPRLSLGNH